MQNMIAYCGLDCSVCPAYIATVNNDDAARAVVAEKWTKEFNMQFRPEDISCDGCTGRDGRHVGYCSMCEIRICGIEKAVENCAHCKDYSCVKISGFHENVAEARCNLEEIRKSL